MSLREAIWCLLYAAVITTLCVFLGDAAKRESVDAPAMASPPLHLVHVVIDGKSMMFPVFATNVSITVDGK